MRRAEGWQPLERRGRPRRRCLGAARARGSAADGSLCAGVREGREDKGHEKKSGQGATPLQQLVEAFQGFQQQVQTSSWSSRTPVTFSY
eukprot:357645-Chlamydomonas_euryale.AAC.6